MDAICALPLTTALPSRVIADVIAFRADRSARTSDWTFHGERPAWASDEDINASLATQGLSVDRAPDPRSDVLNLISATATRHQQNRALVHVGLNHDDWHVLFQAMVEAESSYKPKALSPKGAYGLGQLMPETARSLGVDPRDSSQNLDGAARYLLAQLANFRDIDLALAAYNAGPHRVVEFSGVPPFAETRDYIARIHRIRDRLSGHPEPQPEVRVATETSTRAPVVIDLNSGVSALETQNAYRKSRLTDAQQPERQRISILH
jgi:Transglycosylase SLT domain